MRKISKLRALLNQRSYRRVWPSLLFTLPLALLFMLLLIVKGTEGQRSKGTEEKKALCLCPLNLSFVHILGRSGWLVAMASVSPGCKTRLQWHLVRGAVRLGCLCPSEPVLEWFNPLKVEWQTIADRPLSREDRLKISDHLRIHPKAVSILQRDSVPSPLAEEGKKEKQILQAILARPEFQFNQLKREPVQWPSRYLNWFSWLLKKIALALSRIFGGRRKWLKASKTGPGLLAWLTNPWITYGLISALAIAMLVLLAKFGQSLTCNEKEGEALLQQGLLNLPDSLRESPGYWSKQADFLISQGKNREAFRSLYLALLVGFHRLNYIDFHRCRTNWNYLTHFRGDPQAKNLFQEMTQRFDLVWYGSHSPDPAEYQRYKQAIRGVLNV